MSQTIHILGAGAVGCLVASHLGRHSCNAVTLLLRDGAAVSRFRDAGSGVMLKHYDGQKEAVPCEAQAVTDYPSTTSQASSTQSSALMHTRSVTNINRGSDPHSISSLIIATKAPDTVAAVRSVIHLLAPGGHVLFLQNGALAVYEQLHAQIFKEMLHKGISLPHVSCGSLTHGATLTSPFHVTQASSHGACMLSPVDPSLSTLSDPRHALLMHQQARSQAAAHASSDDQPQLRPSSGHPKGSTTLQPTPVGPVADGLTPQQQQQQQQAALPEQLQHLLSPQGLGGTLSAVLAPSHANFLNNIHTKLAINCAINSLTALLRCQNGQLLSSDWAMALMQQLTAEVAGICPAELSLTKEGLFQAALAVARSTSGNTSSMLADVQAGRRTEVDYLLGYVARRCMCAGCVAGGNLAVCSAPTNSALWKLIKANEQLAASRL